MRKFLLSTFVIVAFGLYLLFEKVSFGSDNTITPPPSLTLNSQNSNFGSTPPPTNSQNNSGMMGNNGIGGMMGQYKNGTYIGDVADAFYGNVQVKVTVSGGQITNVQFLQYPNDRSTSIYINSQAMPYLTQEAIQAQSAQIDGVSGATATSGAFIQSLASALAQAKS